MEAFSSPGAGPARTNSNQADRMQRPHPTTPASGPSYDPDHYKVHYPAWTGDSTVEPSCVRDLNYNDATDTADDRGY